MTVKWSNLVAFLLLLFAAILAVRNQREIASAISAIGHIGPGHTIEDQTIGLGTLGVCLVALVAIVRILCASVEKRNDPASRHDHR